MRREQLSFTYDTFRLLVREIDHFIPGRPHYHSALELIVAPELDVVMRIGGLEHALGERRVACIAPGLVHCMTVRPAPDNRYYCLQLRLEKVPLFGVLLAGGARFPLFPAVDAVRVIDLLEKLPPQRIGEWRKISPGDVSPAAMAGHAAILYELLSLVLEDGGPQRGRNAHHERVRRIIEHLEDHVHESFSLESLARSVGLSRYHLCRLFKSYTGMTLTEYLHLLRIDRAKFLLVQEGATVSRAALSCGYADPAHFIKAFKAREGTTPKQWVLSSQRRGKSSHAGFGPP